MLLIWTTTPWTLPGNVAVAVGPEVFYVRARYGDETLVLAEALVERVLGEGIEILDRFPGRALLGGGGVQYAGPIFELAGGERGGFPIVAGEDGTGLVHIAPAFGEDDSEGQKMSKSKGNTVEPWQVLDEYGADALRWYFFTAKQPWDDRRSRSHDRPVPREAHVGLWPFLVQIVRVAGPRCAIVARVVTSVLCWEGPLPLARRPSEAGVPVILAWRSSS